jgi:hypothetical protein
MVRSPGLTPDLLSLPLQVKRPRPTGEEALYKYPTLRVGYHPSVAAFGAIAGSGGVETPTPVSGLCGPAKKP